VLLIDLHIETSTGTLALVLAVTSLTVQLLQQGGAA
jgi:hypothetical protein